jgi:hypothetical protein
MTVPRERRTAALRILPVLPFLAVLPLMAACSIDVTDDGEGRKKAVDIQSPLGDLSVKTDVDNPDTGLPVYPGARPMRDKEEPESADVQLDSAWFDLRVMAAKYEGDASPAAVVEFYKRELAAYGPVTECRGDIDFKGRRGTQRAVCKERSRSGQVQLVVGTEDQHRIVSVKPRGNGSEFSVVRIRTRDRT